MPYFLRYLILFTVLAQGIVSCKQVGSQLPSLEETYNKRDKIPFGTNVAFREIENLFPHNTIFVKRQDFKTTWHEISDSDALYVCISKNLFLSDADVGAMLQYVSGGNSILIASKNIDRKLLDTLGCTVHTAFESPYAFPDVLTTTGIKFSGNLLRDTTTYNYFYYPFANKFISYDSTNTYELGKNEFDHPNFITIQFGNGRFFLHLEPRAFSNYFLLQKNNYKYLKNVFGYTKTIPEQVFWDDFYCNKNTENSDGNSEGSLNFLLKYPALKWAFWITLLLLFIYIFFGGKRRQRIIKVTEPNKNTTVAFAETVGRLYLQQHNNRNIADKIILHFFEHLRSQYYLNTNHINDIFITTLSRKSNVPIEKVKQLFATIRTVQNNYDVSDQQLLALNQGIENFNKTNI